MQIVRPRVEHPGRRGNRYIFVCVLSVSCVLCVSRFCGFSVCLERPPCEETSYGDNLFVRHQPGRWPLWQFLVGFSASLCVEVKLSVKSKNFCGVVRTYPPLVSGGTLSVLIP